MSAAACRPRDRGAAWITGATRVRVYARSVPSGYLLSDMWPGDNVQR